LFVWSVKCWCKYVADGLARLLEVFLLWTFGTLRRFDKAQLSGVTLTTLMTAVTAARNQTEL
jgi:hypothetical protein